MQRLLVASALLLAVLAWTGQAAIIRPNSARAPASFNQNGKEPNITLKFIENAMEDYVELAEAFYAPAPSETVREKRTLAVFRTIANRTRSGLATVRNLVQSFNGGSSGSGSSSGGFRSFFSTLITRILTFFTRLWDRITGLFGRGGESGSGGGGFFSRLQTGVAGLVSRFSGGGGGGGLGGLFRTTTTESSFYPDFVYTTEKTTTTTTTEAPAENDLAGLGEIDLAKPATDDAEREGKELSADSEAGGYNDFIPFPGETDPELGVRSGSGVGTRSAKFSRDIKPHVVKSPEVLHLIGGQRLVVVE